VIVRVMRGVNRAHRTARACGKGDVARASPGYPPSGGRMADTMLRVPGGGSMAGVGCVCGGLLYVWWRTAGWTSYERRAGGPSTGRPGGIFCPPTRSSPPHRDQLVGRTLYCLAAFSIGSAGLTA